MEIILIPVSIETFKTFFVLADHLVLVSMSTWSIFLPPIAGPMMSPTFQDVSIIDIAIA